MKSTGLPVGTFKNMDRHPTIEGLVFRGYGKRKGGKIGEDWITTEAMLKREAKKAEYRKRPEIAMLKAIASRKSRRENPDKHREAVKKCHRKYKDRRAAYAKEYRERNRAYFAESEARRRARINDSSEPQSVTDKLIIRQIYAYSKRLGECTGFQWHVDHIKPISLGGAHVISNLQVVPQVWNQSKRNRNSDRIQTL